MEPNNRRKLDMFRSVMKVCVLVGMLVSSLGLSMFAYFTAYPRPHSNVPYVQISCWLIISGMAVVIICAMGSQMASYLKRGKTKNKSAVESGTALFDDEESRSLMAT